MTIENIQAAAQKVAVFLDQLNKLGGLRFKYKISAGEMLLETGGTAPKLAVELAGSDVPLLTQHNGELLRALETVAAQMLRLDQREQDQISFDAGNYKAMREAELQLAAETAAEKVIRTGVPYAFPPMNSRERRQLHLAFKSISGVETASNGEGLERYLAVYPAGRTDLPVAAPVRPRSAPRR